MNLPVEWAIRRADAAETPEIAAVLADCWPDDTPDPARIARLAGSAGRVTLCACGGGMLAGFADTFMTRSADGAQRLEIDLLAVRSEARGRGLGRALVDAAVRQAPSAASRARAFIRVDNIASERTFAAADFAGEAACRVLYTASPHHTAIVASGVYLVQVETLTYSGLWVEGAITADGLGAARGAAAQRGLDVAGVVVPATGSAASICEHAGFSQRGIYRWWARSLNHRLGERGSNVVPAADDD